MPSERRGCPKRAIALNVIRPAGTDLDTSIQMNTQIEKAILKAFPDEVEHVWSRIGMADIATDPMGIELTDIYITLKPRARWKKAKTQAELTTLVERELRFQPGQQISYQQPIEMRMAEMETGIRADLGVLLYGDDFDVLRAKAAEIERVMKGVGGVADLAVSQLTGQPVLEIVVKQDQVARYGVPARAVLDLVESIGSKPLGEVTEGGVLPISSATAGPVAWQPGGHRRNSTADRERRAHPAVAARGHPHRRGAIDHHARVGPAADQRHVQRARPRPRQLRGRSAREDRGEGRAPAGALPHRVQRSVRGTPARDSG